MPLKNPVDPHSLRRVHARLLSAVVLGLVTLAAHAGLGLQRIITLPEIRGQLGGLALDRVHQRVFVAATGSGGLLAVDVHSGEIVDQVTGLERPRTVVYLPDNRLAVSDSSSGVIGLYDANTLNLQSSLIVGQRAGALCSDDAAGQLYFGYGRGSQHDIAVLNDRGKLRAQLPAPGIPRGLVLDPVTHRLYAGFSELNGVVVFDVARQSRIATWTLDAPAAATFPMALDEAGNRLFVGGRSGDQIAVIDTQTGRLLQNIPAPGDAATLDFDSEHRELYVPGGIGQLAVYKEDNRGLLHEVERIPTRHGARNGLLDPESGRYYLAVPAFAGKPAEVRVYLIVEPSGGEGS